MKETKISVEDLNRIRFFLIDLKIRYIEEFDEETPKDERLYFEESIDNLKGLISKIGECLL